jgi:hypothetical protein
MDATDNSVFTVIINEREKFRHHGLAIEGEPLFPDWIGSLPRNGNMIQGLPVAIVYGERRPRLR